MKKTLQYSADNGYKGVLYGKSSFSIYDRDGKKIFHTGSRTINTYEELIKEVEDFPDFLKILKTQ